jgi:DNA-binding CsgD family transcriptional regulator
MRSSGSPGGGIPFRMSPREISLGDDEMDNVCTCKSCGDRLKTPFKSKDAAVTFEAENRKQYNRDPQFPYECPSVAGVWHLTSKPQNIGNYAQVKYDNPAATSGRTPSNFPTFKLTLEERRTQCQQLLKAGWTRAKIADELGVSSQTIDNYIRDAKASGVTVPPAHLTLGTIEQEEQALLEKMRTLQAKKAALIEATKVKAQGCANGMVLISQGIEKFHMKADDVPTLIQRLEEYITRPVAAAVSA